MALPGRLGGRGVAPALAILVLALLLFDSLEKSSVTVDEFAHLPAGLAYWQTGRFEVYHHNPPLLRLLAAAPLAAAGVEAPLSGGPPGRWQLGERFMRENASRYHALFTAARSVVVLLTCATALLLHAAARSLLGAGPALVALVLFCFSPTVLAHGGLVTTDAGFALAFFAACVAGARLFAAPSGGRALLVGVVLGVAQLTKFTALLLYPLLLVAGAGLGPLVRRLEGGPGLGWLAVSRGRRAALLAAAFAVSLGVVNAGYLFRGSGLPLSAHAPAHPVLVALAETPLGSLPLPLPADFVRGFDAQYVESSAHFSVYLLGETRTRGWWFYYPLALLLKLPPPLFLLLGALAVSIGRRTVALTPALFGCLAVPAACLAAFVLLTDIDLGIRYLLFLLPLLHLAAAHLARSPRTRSMTVLLGFSLVWYVGSALYHHPHHLAYFTPLVGGAERGHRYLADSNLDWGQDLVRLRSYLEERGLERVALSSFGLVDPAVYGIRAVPLTEAPRTGVAVVSVNHLLGIHPWGRPRGLERYRGREPTARVGYSLWVFEEP